MTHDQARQRLQALADEIGREAPRFFGIAPIPNSFRILTELLPNTWTTWRKRTLTTLPQRWRQTESPRHLLTSWLTWRWMAASASFANMIQLRPKARSVLECSFHA